MSYDPYYYEDDQVEQRIAALEARERQMAEAAALAQLEDAVEQQLDQLGVPNDDRTRDLIVSRAVAMQPTEQGLPDVAGAYGEFVELMASQGIDVDAPPAPEPLSPDATREERREWVAQRGKEIDDHNRHDRLDANEGFNLDEMSRSDRLQQMADQLQANEE